MFPSPELIDQVAALHEDAFTWAATCCGGDLEAGADALQECYAKVAMGRARFAGRSSLKTWWLAVIRLTVLEQLRGEQRWKRKVEAFREWVADLGGESPEPAEGFTAGLTAEQLKGALAQLPARQAEVLHLVFQQDLSVGESAAVMGVSVGSARQHYERAKRRLREALGAKTATPHCDHAK